MCAASFTHASTPETAQKNSHWREAISCVMNAKKHLSFTRGYQETWNADTRGYTLERSLLAVMCVQHHLLNASNLKQAHKEFTLERSHLGVMNVQNHLQ